MPDTPDSYEKTAMVLLQHLLRGEPHFDLCLISQSGDCRNFDGCFDHATKVLAGLLRENIPTSTADLDATYPLKAAGRMAARLTTEDLDADVCPMTDVIEWEGCTCDVPDPLDCRKNPIDCWLQYFRERAEEVEDA